MYGSPHQFWYGFYENKKNRCAIRLRLNLANKLNFNKNNWCGMLIFVASRSAQRQKWHNNMV